MAVALGGAAVASWLLWGRPAGSTQPVAPGALAGHNLLLVTIDTLRADRLGCYGSSAGLTPTLDRLASEGIRFEHAVAHAVTTLPSHTSLLTGQYPLTHGVHDNGTFVVKPSQPTLATALESAGYQTAAFVGAFVLDSRFGLARGFAQYDDEYDASGDVQAPALSAFEVVERRADRVVERAERWIRASGGKRWFAWVHLYDPHTPYDAPRGVHAAPSHDPYDAEVAYTDSVLGAFLDRLREAGALGRTLLIATSDHGEALGDHGERTHGTFAYNATLRVPWLVWAAGDLRPQVFDETVRHVDLVPTALDLLGVPPPRDVDGRSLRPFLGGERTFDPASSYFEALHPHLTRNWAPLRGLVSGHHKLIDLPVPELYDLRRDPAERENLFVTERGVAQALASELRSLRGEAEPVRTAAPEPETRKRLEALGYVSGPAAPRKTRYTEEDDPKRRVALNTQYEQAAEWFGRGEVQRALGLLREVVRQERDSPQAHQQLAYVLHHAGSPAGAIRVLEDAVRGGIHGPSILTQLGIYLLRAGELGRSTTLLSDVVRQDPSNVEAHTYLGIAHSRQGRKGEARGEFEAVLEIDPGSASARSNLGTLEVEAGRFQKAIAHFKAAIASDPQLAAAHNGLGVAHAAIGETENAVESWRRALELDPGQLDALYNVGTALAARTPPHDAVRYLEDFVRTAPPDAFRDEIARARRLLLEIERGKR